LPGEGVARENKLGELGLPEAAVVGHPLGGEQPGVDALPERPEVGEGTSDPS